MGKPLLEVETDKSTLEVESQDTGILRSILMKEGSTVPWPLSCGWIGGADESVPVS